MASMNYIRARRFNEAINAVSYTHLDVYKRQILVKDKKRRDGYGEDRRSHI